MLYNEPKFFPFFCEFNYSFCKFLKTQAIVSTIFFCLNGWLQFIDILQIDNHKERGDPAGDAELNEMILNETLCGGAAEAEDNHVLEIAQEAGKYPSAGEVDITGAHALDHLGRHGVHDVANQGN